VRTSSMFRSTSRQILDTDPAGERSQWKPVESGSTSRTRFIPSVRLHIAGFTQYEADVDRTAESLKQMPSTPPRERRANLENDDNFTEDPFFIVDVIEKWKPYLGPADFCNSMMTHDQEFNNRAWKRCSARLLYLSHEGFEVARVAKSARWTSPVLRHRQGSGYRGYFSMEWEGKGEPNAGTQQLIDETLRNLA